MAIRARHILISRTVLSSAGLAALVAFSPVAQAQDAAAKQQAAPAEAGKDIVVTGYRRSVEKTLSVKRNTVELLESVSAEDVGKLPSTSITEALGQLPGVTAQRLAGRADLLSVRGFGPDFTTALFNHREIATTGDDRNFQYDKIPAEFINRGDVKKTASANMVYQGLAGVIDLQTIDPLAQTHRILTVKAQGEINSYSKQAPDVTNKGYNAALIYADKFADGTLGITLGGSILSTPQQIKQYQAWGFPTDANNNYVLGGAKFFATGNLEKRESLMGRVAYRPDENFETSFDVFYTHFKTTEQQRGLEVPMFWGGLTPTNNTVVNGFDTVSTFSGVHAVQRNNYNSQNANTLALGWNVKYKVSDGIRLTLDASYSRAHRHDTNLETYTGLGYKGAGAADTITVRQLASGAYSLTTTLNYNDATNFKLTDPQGWGYNGTSAVVQAGFLNSPDFIDRIGAFRAGLNGDLDSSIFSGWDVGVNYQDRKKTSGFKSYFLQPNGSSASTPTSASNLTALPASIVYSGGVTPYGLTSGSTLAYDPLAAMGLLNPVFDNRPASLARDYVVSEKVLTAFAQMNIASHIGDIGVKGNFGLQFVHTDQNSTGSAANLSGTGSVSTVPLSGGLKYNYVLPSFNTQFEVAPGTYVRLAAARTLSRARQQDLRVSTELSGNNGNAIGTIPGTTRNYYYAGNGGNPGLKPYLSDNVDLSIEKYFAGGQGLFQIDGFYKHLTNYVNPSNVALYTADTSVRQAILSPAQVAAISSNEFLLGTSGNTGRGKVQGVEMNAVLPLSMVAKPLSGFGLMFNGAYTDSSVNYSGSAPATSLTGLTYVSSLSSAAGTITVPGLSKWVYSATLYFERNGFSARTAYSHRSTFLCETSTVTQAASLSQCAATSDLSAQVGYEFKEGPAKGLSVYLQGKNLTDSAFKTYANNDPRQVINYEKYGRSFLLGATMKF